MTGQSINEILPSQRIAVCDGKDVRPIRSGQSQRCPFDRNHSCTTSKAHDASQRQSSPAARRGIARRFCSMPHFVSLERKGRMARTYLRAGDSAGFVRALDDTHLLLPDRIGNNRFDCYANLFANPRIGMLFLVPGMGETLRINGTARVVDDEALLAPCALNGRTPPDRAVDQGARGLPPLRQSHKSCGTLGPLEAYRPIVLADLQSNARRSSRRPHARGKRKAGRGDEPPGHLTTSPCLDSYRASTSFMRVTTPGATFKVSCTACST